MFKGVVCDDADPGLLIAVGWLAGELVIVDMVDWVPAAELDGAELISVELLVLEVEVCVASQVAFRLSSGAAFVMLSLRWIPERSEALHPSFSQR